MRKQIWLVAGLLCCAVATPLSAQYRISGRIANHEGTVLLLVPTVTGTCDTLKRAVSDRGSFCFEGITDESLAAEIQAEGTRFRMPVYLENASLEVEADVKHPDAYRVTGGGPMQQLRNEFRKEELRLFHQRDSLRDMYEKENDMNDFFGRMQVVGLLEQYDDLYSKLEDEFIRCHDNMVSAGLLAWRIEKLTHDKTLPAKYALLGQEARRSVQGRWLKGYVDRVARIAVGGIAPDLKMQTPEGGTLSLYSVKAKVKILDFWASWCGPCRAENPNVRSVYEKYHEKGLEVVSVSLDVKADAWRKAIEVDGMVWKHMSDLKGWNSQAATVYGINAIPRLFVLDQNNRIIAEGLRGEELEKCVKKILEKE